MSSTLSRPLLRPRRALCVLAGAVVLATSPAAHAFSGFLRPPGQGYAKLSFDGFSSNELYGTGGDRLTTRSSPSFEQLNVSLYAEVGIFEVLTVGTSGAALRLQSFENTSQGSGVGDLQLFAKSGLAFAGFHGALLVALELPTGLDDATVTLAEDPTIQTLVPTGDGETNVWIRLAVSRPFPVLPGWSAYASLHGGVNVRTEFSEQISLGGEIGIMPGGWFWLQARLDALLSPTPVEDLDPAGTFLFGEGTEYLAWGLGVAVPIPGTPVALTGDYRNTFALLRNLYAGSTFGGGVSVEW